MLRNCNWSWLLIGLLVIPVTACRPTTEEEPVPDIIDSISPTPQATAVAQQATATPTRAATAVPPPPPKPTPPPTSSYAGNWRQVGGAATGMEFGMHSEWVNLSGSLDVSSATNPLGLIVLLVADSERTGRSLLAGKALNEGAFSVGLVANQVISTDDPVSDLTRLIAEQEGIVSSLNQAQTIKATNASGSVTGATIDIVGDPLRFFNTAADQLRARLLLFPVQTRLAAQDGRNAILYLFSAPTDQWEQYAATFDQMAQSIVVHDIQTGYALSDGTANVLGSLIDGRIMAGELESGVKNIWTFTIDEARYATISLTPEETDLDLDLSLTIVDPTGQTIARIDNGYAGDTEVAADILLIESGRYIIEVSEFFNASGRYMLSFILDEEPRFSSAGIIRPGQGIQSELPVNAQHVWTFNGSAGQLVSIVLAPADNLMDPILNLYGPDGDRLVALDEGFSGDPEVISGFELSVTGAYSIMVSSFADHGGKYTLTLDEGGEAIRNFYDAGDIAYGELKGESLRRSEAQAWFFEGRAGDSVRIAAQPLNDIMDLDVWLFDPDIQRLAAKDELAAGDTEVIEIILPQDGQYLILVREFLGEAGSYEIELSATPAAVPQFAGFLTYGEVVTGTLAPEQMVYWQFSADQKDVIDIELSPGQVMDDVVFALQDPNDKIVLEVDGALAGQNEVLQAFPITADGLWGVVVKDFFGEGSTYSLLVNRTGQ